MIVFFFQVLIPKLREPDPNPGVTINVLACLGELAQVSGVAMRDYTPELLPLIIDMLQDSSSIQKREVSRSEFSMYQTSLV